MKKHNIYIDCTDIIQTELNTGIQRVARNIINNRFSAQQKLGITCQPVYYDKQYGFIKVPGCHKNDLKNSIGYLHSVHSCVSQFWRFKRLTKAIFPFPQFQNWLDRHWQGMARWLLMWPLFLAVSPVVVAALIYAMIITPRNCWKPTKNDILTIPGSSWWDSNLHLKAGIHEVKANAGRVAIILYDLIPISHPQYCTEDNANNFTANFPFIVTNTDLFVAISQTTENALKQYLIENTSLRKPATSHFFLGADLDLIKQTFRVRKSLQAQFAANKPYLCVGTIEPRKNHALLLDAFDEIWKNNHDLHLCLIGHYGWKSEKLVERIKNHPLFGDNLTWFSYLDDTELSYCYNNAKALIFPSIIEGFGLPLIEALHYGCPVMASDIPVFREIGADRCAYFPLDTPDGLVSQINELETSGELPSVQQSDDFKWINWEESALEFYKIIAEHFEIHENSPTH